VLFLEGCALKCSFRLVKAAILIKAKTDVVIADKLCKFDPELFRIDEMEDSEIKLWAENVAKKVTELLKKE
jgi:hypothetical protein